MNCKPGDIAIVVRAGATAENVGKLVEVIGPSAAYPGWWTVQSLSGWLAGASGRAMAGNIEDHRLRPLRDSDGDDETLTWVGKPAKVSA
jgi:hypothetical protein